MSETPTHQVCILTISLSIPMGPLQKCITGKYSEALMPSAQVQTCCHACFCSFTGMEGSLKELLQLMGQTELSVALRPGWAAWLSACCLQLRQNPMACLACSRWRLRCSLQKKSPSSVSGRVTHLKTERKPAEETH